MGVVRDIQTSGEWGSVEKEAEQVSKVPEEHMKEARILIHEDDANIALGE